MKRRPALVLAGTACFMFLLPPPALAQAGANAVGAYPARPVRIIVPLTPGGGVDMLARIVGQHYNAVWGQPFIVDNRPGAGGNIGTEAAARARPDGYTLLMGSVGANVTPAAVQANYPFDPLRDYVPISVVAEWSAILVVKKDLPVTTLAEFVAYARARPGALNFGTTGYGSFAHLIAELFMQQAGIKMQHVQYKGGSQATADLLAGAIDAHMMSSAVGAGQADNPMLKMLAVASPRRLPSLPKVPTMAEAGVAGVEQTAWLAVFSPPLVPEPVRMRLSRELVALANDPIAQTKFRNTGFEPVGTDPATTDKTYRSEIARWTALVRERGLAEK
jgi:tripartite-type tricarboxylate transporter receptor subunit TctC